MVKPIGKLNITVTKLKHLPLFVCFLGLILFLNSCSVTKKLEDHQYLLTKNKFEFKEEEEPLKKEVGNYVKQKPNRKLAGILPLDVWLYNISPKKFDQSFKEYYTISEVNRNLKALDSILEKNGLDKYVGRSLWFKRLGYSLGEAPVAIDTSLLKRSNQTLEIFYNNNGYFDAQIQSELKKTGKKRAKVIYTVNPGDATYVSKYNYEIANKDLKDIYEINIAESHVNGGEIYRYGDFVKEESRISNLYKNNGYYDFNDDAEQLYFEARSDSLKPKELDVVLKIKKNEGDSAKFNQYFFENITLYPDSRQIDKNAEYLTYHQDNYTFKFLNTPEHRLDYFIDALRIKPYNLYKLDDEVNTKRNLFRRENFNLGQVQVFKNKEHPDSLLDANILMKPKNKYNFKVFFEAYDSEYLRYGLSPGLSLLRRNVFGGGENLELALRASLATPDADFSDNTDLFSAYEYGGDLKLSFPYLLLPFNLDKKNLFENVDPSTDIRIGTSVQRNIGLDRINYSGGLDYRFTSNNVHNHRFSIFNTEIINNSNQDIYFDVIENDFAIFENGLDIYEQFRPDVVQAYRNGELTDDQIIFAVNNDQMFLDSLNASEQSAITEFQNMAFRRASLLQNNFINSFIYQYTYDQTKREGKQNPWFFRGQAEFAGNLLAIADRIIGFDSTEFNNRRASTVLGIPYSQFVKIDLDVRKYFKINSFSTLVIRQFAGLALPFGNSELIPIDKSYFGGGSTDIRAWRAYDLGPGGTSTLGEFNVSNFKLTWNLEYRFQMFGLVEGALFADAGNIWSINNGANVGEFRLDSFAEQIALGSGFGFRLDFTYFKVRLDLGYKIHNPALNAGQRWDFNILAPRFNFGINYPF